MMSRADALVAAREDFDLCVIGGGATGAGCALDAQLRGLKTILVEANDFASATSSASTKLIHGGIRYLREAAIHLEFGQIAVVKRALHERIHMLKNAPFLAGTCEFIIPCYSRWEQAYFGIGVKLYDVLAGKANLLPSRRLSRSTTLQRLPMLQSDGLAGSVTYSDGQFDDAGYNLALVRTFTDKGGIALNHARVVRFRAGADGKLSSAEVRDELSGCIFEVRARAFTNATGPAADNVRAMANPAAGPRLKLSKGAHILLPLDLFPCGDALLIPETSDGRVIFAIPWMGRLLVGTTDEAVNDASEVSVSKADVDYLLRHLNQFVTTAFTVQQIVAGFAGIRPLLAANSRETKSLSRDHMVEIDGPSGLVSILGGKWTTYRAMAEDTINAVEKHLHRPLTPCRTRDYRLAGSASLTATLFEELVREYDISLEVARHLAGKFGAGARDVLSLAMSEPDLKKTVVDGFPAIRAEILYAIHSDMAMTIEDILARRLGLQFFSWKLSVQAAPIVAQYMAREFGWSDRQQEDAVDDYVRKLKRMQQTAGLGN